MDREALLRRAATKGVNPLVYWLVRAVIQPFFHLYFRLSRIGREHIPEQGAVILAANHRSFLDPFVIGTMVRRPVYFVSKQELFRRRSVAWILNSLGAFPIDRGNADGDAMATARTILERGDVVVIFPEGTRTRPGALGRPKRGVGRLALETGAAVVPVAVIGTEAVRRGWRIRPHKVRIRAGAPLRFPRVDAPSAALAGAVTDRLWPSVALQWEWLGGTPPVRRAAVIGAGAPGMSIAAALARAGLDVDLALCGHDAFAARAVPVGVNARQVEDLDLTRHDLVVLAVPTHELPAVVAAHGDAISRRAGVLVLGDGLVEPLGAVPVAYVGERCGARAIASAALPEHESVMLAGTDRGFVRELAAVLARGGLDVGTMPSERSRRVAA